MEGPQLKVTQAGLEHLAELAPMFDSYRVFYRQKSSPEAALEFLQQRLSKADSVIFLADVDGEAAGFTQLYPMFTSVGMARIWILNDLFVPNEFRRRGVAEALMKTAVEFARSEGAVSISLETQQSNTQASALYQKLGWKKEDEYDYYSLRLTS
jgi:ribosomal protein S18 acetylase RimI-like enzyme